MDIQRLRNLTTRRLHTEMDHIYQDIGYLTGMDGVMTHMIPNVMRAMDSWLKEKVVESKFWDGEHDPDHCGDFKIEPMNEQEQKLVLQKYSELPHPFAST